MTDFSQALATLERYSVIYNNISQGVFDETAQDACHTLETLMNNLIQHIATESKTS